MIIQVILPPTQFLKKSDACNSFESFYGVMQNIFPEKKIAFIRCDNARELTRGAMEQFCKSKNITYDDSNPYTPEQHARAERYNGNLGIKTRSIICSMQKCQLLNGLMPFRWLNL